MVTQVEIDYEHGLWVPSYHGLKYKAARNRGPHKGEERTVETFAMLAEARNEADRLNGRV